MICHSQTTGYAVLALACIGSCGGVWVKTEDIHKCTGVPKPYLRKLLHALGKAGLINTKRGYKGGFVLARPPREISLLDVAQAVDSREPGSNCLMGLVGCSDANPCPVRRFWRHERKKIEAELTRTTLAEAAKFVKESQGLLTKCPPPDRPPANRPKSSKKGKG